MANNYLYIGPPGSGKTYKAKSKIIDIIKNSELSGLKSAFPSSKIKPSDLNGNANDVFSLLRKDFSEVISVVSMHPGYGYSDFVEGVSVTSKNGAVVFSNKKKVFLSIIDNMQKRGCAGFIILDDIDRVNISMVFGGLLEALENRNTQYTLMGGYSVAIPENLYVILTMRTMQSSNKPDYGFLRRFNIERLAANNGKLSLAINDFVGRNSLFIKDVTRTQDQVDTILGTPSKTGLYDYYNGIAKNVMYEFKDDVEDYEIGFTYFLPSENSDVNLLDISCQHKIHHQVIPLLQQYAKDGIIDKLSIPPVVRTNTVFTRVRNEVHEPMIVLSLDNDTWEYGRDIFSRSINIGKNVAYSKTPGRGSLKVNRPYLMVFEIVHDMIEHNLLNEFQLMDIFTDDKRIFCARRDLSFGGGGVFAENSIADQIIMKNGGDLKNSYSLYNPNFHLLRYNKKTYRMISKLSGSEMVPIKLTKCFAAGEGGQNSSAFKGLKVLVHAYLEQFKKNLDDYIKIATGTDKVNAQNDLRQLIIDIKTVENMTTDGAAVGKPYYIGTSSYIYRDMVNIIRSLPTWNGMLNGTLKGVYRQMDFNYKAIMEVTGIHQMILQGPPGTSKTFGAKEFISQQIGLTGPTDIGFDKDELQTHKLILKDGKYELPGSPASTNKVYWDVIQFHPSYCYEDFVRGITVSTSGASKKINGTIHNSATAYDLEMDPVSSISYKTINKTFGALCELAKDNTDCVFYLLVDEINRANLATVFGELIYALEYRDEDVATPYVLDAGGDNLLTVPDNVYIIGTMNTADKSIGNIDYAIRRRFLFFPALPSVEPVINSITDGKVKESSEMKLFYGIKELFEKNLNSDDYDMDDVRIGHTYFIRKEKSTNPEDEMQYRFLFQIIPILKEYVKDGVLINNDTYNVIIETIFKMTSLNDANSLKKEYDDLLSVIESDSEYVSYIDELLNH